MSTHPLPSLSDADVRHPRKASMSVSRLRGLIYAQDGVVSREQLVATGLAVGFGQDRVRSGRWQRLAVGVYLTNSGIVTFTHRCWAAVLHAGAGAAITGDAAAYLDHSVDRPPQRIDVVVPHGRRVRAPGPDVVVTRTRIPYTIEERPPRTSAVTTALHRLRSADTATDVIAILTGAARALGSACPLRAEVARRTHVPWRGIVTAILAPENEGHESVLEWNFTTKVLTAHGLPVPRRQKRERLGQNQIRIDGISEEWGVRFELDGRLHEGKTDDDIWRDNEATVSHGQPTLRFRWLHVLGRTCETARQVERGYRSRGWSGHGRRCGTACPVGLGD
ncbi:hypothetical protein [Salana multivorans]